MTLLVVALIVTAILLGLAYFRLLPGQSPADGTARALRELLQARAEGRIDDAEFQARQAALHTLVLAADEATARRGLPVPLIWAIPLFVAAAAVAFYTWSGGSPDADVVSQSGGAGSAGGAGGASPSADGTSSRGGDMAEAVKRLAEKMSRDPSNGDGWLLLARAYNELRQAREAADAYAKAAALVQLDAASLANWADAHVMSNDRKWDAKARDIVKRALAADPRNLKALALAGTEAFERAAYPEAITFWKRMRAEAAPDSIDAKLADANIEEATALIGGKKPAAPKADQAPVAAPSGSPNPAPAVSAPAAIPSVALAAVAGNPADAGSRADAAAAVSGTVALDAALKASVAPTDTVFVIARSVDGAGAPLAVKRFQASQLPVSFRLDDSAAMVPERTVGKATEVLVSARLSRSGNALAQPGDLQSQVVRTRVGADRIQLRIAPPG